MIFLPSSRPQEQTGPLRAGFASDLINLSPSPSATAQPAAVPASSTAQDPEDWDALSDATPLTPSTGPLPSRSILHHSVADVLPDISTIDRPEELSNRPPYLLIVQQEGPAKVIVQCSHQASLVLLEKYLTKWARTRPDQVNRVSLVQYLFSPLAPSRYTFRLLN